MIAGWKWTELVTCCGPQTVPICPSKDKESAECFCCVNQDSVLHVTKNAKRPFPDVHEYHSPGTRNPESKSSHENGVEIEEVRVGPEGKVQAYSLHGQRHNYEREAEVTSSKKPPDSSPLNQLKVRSDVYPEGLHPNDAPCDFNGWWRCVQINGNMRDFLRDMGLNEDNLEEAAYTNYGIGEQVQHIIQTGHFFEVENFLTDPVRMQFRVGEGDQLTVDRGNRPIIVDPQWDGPVLYIKSRRVTGETIAHSRRFFDGDLMVLEFTSPKGIVVERIYKRK